MRGDGLGVGHIREMPSRTWGCRHSSGGDDGRTARREHVAGLVGGYGEHEHDAARQPRRDGIGIDDGARGEYGHREVYGAGAGGTVGVRGDGVGVGDVGEVPGGAWGTRISTDGLDGGRSEGKRDTGVELGPGKAERDAQSQR